MNETDDELFEADDVPQENDPRPDGRGLLLRPDDLVVGQLLTVHHWRDGRPFGMGHAMRLTAICLPYVVVQPLPQSRWRAITLDLRDAVLMQVSPEYADAQTVCDPEDVPGPGPGLQKPDPFLSQEKNDQ